MSASGFIPRAACRGRRPSQLASCVVHSRPALVSRLLKNRDVARFIVAPSGYGKSYLALEYAESMKLWSHTFWINAKSPCFVRDLDQESLLSLILGFDSEAELVIFDDLPLLDSRRMELFSLEIDKLLSEGCEVLVTCVPSCDMASHFQHDRQRIGAAELLLSDKEIDEMRTADERLRKRADLVGPAWRVPQLVWSLDLNREELFVKNALAEELPNDLLFMLCSAFVLQSGSLGDLAALVPHGTSTLEDLAKDYPHLGFEIEDGTFEVPQVRIEDLTAALRSKLAQITSDSRYTKHELIFAWADVLLGSEKANRACELVQQMCPHAQQGSWVIDHAVEIVRQACFAPAFRLLAGIYGCTGAMRMRLEAFEALCRRLLGDETGAVQCAKKNAFSDKAPEDARILSLLLVARLDAGAFTQRARESLEAQFGPDSAKSETLSEDASMWRLLATAWCASMRGAFELSQLLEGFFDSDENEDALCICSSWLFSMFNDVGIAPHKDDLVLYRQAERFVRERLVDAAQDERVDFFTISAGLSMEEAHAYGYVFEGGPLETSSLILLRRMQTNVLLQRRYFEEDARLEQARRDDWVATHPATFSSMGAYGAHDMPERAIPLLSLKMFGCFEVSVGGTPIEYGRFKRQNTRALLVLLAVNQGKEVSRDTLARTMWPQSSPEVARKNFYTVWSHLRRALALPDGTCPYLVRHRYGCSLDTRFVQSDVDRLSEICRELLFSSPNVEHWSLLFSEIDRDFSGDLMPAETKNALIVQARNDFRTRLVDALVAATESIVEADIPQWGVWFARAAIERDDTREDAYVALMRAQIAGNQRTAAMSTYLKCRRVLSEKLGIDPSPETTALYESLLDAA